MLFKVTLQDLVVPHDALPLVDELLKKATERIAYMTLAEGQYGHCILPIKQYHGFQLDYLYPESEAEYRLNTLAHLDYDKSKSST